MNGSQRELLARLAHDALVARGFEPDVPPDAERELDRIAGPAAVEGAGAPVEDLRALPWCSIDNDESKDLDQLTVARERAADGTDTVLVAIADVDALVPKGAPLDGHAGRNTTSVYTPAAVFPMLPERLSTGLTSLGAGEDRVALVVELAIGPDGALARSRVFRGLVRNAARLAYDAVGAWLETAAAAPPALAAVRGLDANLRLQDDAACRFSRWRHAHGALDFDSLETRFVWGAHGLADVVAARRNRAKALIENLMIAANVATAQAIERAGFPSVRRVVREPHRWPRIVEIAAQHGHTLPAEPDAPALQRFLTAAREADPVRFPELSLAVIKLLGPGEYVLERAGEDGPGHFSLSLKDYTHSTAPNRRYADLVTHRLLKAALAGATSPYGDDELDAIAKRCTLKEDDAAKVERQLRKSAAALLLEGRAGQGFDGLVTGASDKGTWVRVFHPSVEGRVVRGADGMDVGDRVRVRLVRTDVEHGFIDFERA